MKGVSTIFATIIMVVITIGLITVAYLYMTEQIHPYKCVNKTIERPCCLIYTKEKMCFTGSYMSFGEWKSSCVDMPHFENTTICE